VAVDVPESVCVLLCLQVEAHPYWPNTALVNTAQAAGIHVTAHSPLGSPDSATIMQRSATSRRLLDDPAVTGIAARIGKTPAQVTYSSKPLLIFSCCGSSAANLTWQRQCADVMATVALMILTK
jgi:hypothetical protein